MSGNRMPGNRMRAGAMRRVLASAAAIVSGAIVGAVPVHCGPATAATGKLTQAQAEARLRAAAVTWSSSGTCANRALSSCTSLDQINTRTIEWAVTLRRSSGCDVNITGGTEAGHAGGRFSHQNGYKVDISQYICISSYISRKFTYIGKRSDGSACWKAGSGNIYCREASHWDITFH